MVCWNMAGNMAGADEIPNVRWLYLKRPLCVLITCVSVNILLGLVVQLQLLVSMGLVQLTETSPPDSSSSIFGKG